MSGESWVLSGAQGVCCDMSGPQRHTGSLTSGAEPSSCLWSGFPLCLTGRERHSGWLPVPVWFSVKIALSGKKKSENSLGESPAPLHLSSIVCSLVLLGFCLSIGLASSWKLMPTQLSRFYQKIHFFWALQQEVSACPGRLLLPSLRFLCVLLRPELH